MDGYKQHGSQWINGAGTVLNTTRNAIGGFHLTSQSFPNMGIRHSCVPRSAKFMVIVRHLYRPFLVFMEFFRFHHGFSGR